MDKITLLGVECRVKLGVPAEERAKRQKVLIDVVMEADCSRLRFLRILPKVFKGTHLREDVIEVRRGREVRISADRPFTVYADGDPIAELPATIRCLPAAISVLLPATSPVAA